jgi:hypothetical protein
MFHRTGGHIVSDEIIRNEKGQLVKGTASLNPGGRPRGVSRYIRDKYGDNLELLIDKLAELLENTGNEQLAANIIERFIDRVVGKPTQHGHFEIDTPMPIKFVEGKDEAPKCDGDAPVRGDD